jgi:hypothetical protein
MYPVVKIIRLWHKGKWIGNNWGLRSIVLKWANTNVYDVFACGVKVVEKRDIGYGNFTFLQTILQEQLDYEIGRAC